MKKFIITALFAAAFSSAFAGTHKIPKGDAIATVTVPDKWKTEAEDDSLDIVSDDEEVYINIEALDYESVEGAVKEAMGYLQKNKVKVDPATAKKQAGEANGMKFENVDFDGTDEDGPCKISITVLGVTPKKALVLLYWASPEAEKKHEKELSAIQASIKPVAK